MIGGCETTIDNAGVVAEPEKLVAVIANEKEPYDSNEPVKAPVCEFSETPGGRLPVDTEYTTAGYAPLATLTPEL